MTRTSLLIAVLSLTHHPARRRMIECAIGGVRSFIVGMVFLFLL